MSFTKMCNFVYIYFQEVCLPECHLNRNICTVYMKTTVLCVKQLQRILHAIDIKL